MREDRQFLRRIATIDIHRGVRFRIAQFLCIPQCLCVVDCAFFHRRDDIVAGTVEDTTNGTDLVGRKALRNVGNDWNPSPDACLECNGPAQCSGTIKQFFSMFGKQRFIGGDDIFSCIEQLEHDRPCWLDPTDQMCHDLNFWILEHAL